MTTLISHLESLEDAEAARTVLETSSSSSLQFDVHEIYLLQRKRDDGQFMRVASFGLGRNATVQIHDPQLPFPGMPPVEEEWVRCERLKFKRRRNGRTRR